MWQEFDREEVLVPKVNATLACVVNSGIRAKIDRNVAKELCKKLVRPRNGEAVVVPKINKEFLFLFDLILCVHSTIFQLWGTGLPGLNQY